MERRTFLGATAAATLAAPLAAPSVARAQDTFTWRMTNSYGPGAPFYATGPGSPTDIIEKIRIMSGAT